MKMLENGAVAPLLEGLKHKKYEVRSASVFALGGLLGYATSIACFFLSSSFSDSLSVTL